MEVALTKIHHWNRHTAEFNETFIESHVSEQSLKLKIRTCLQKLRSSLKIM